MLSQRNMKMNLSRTVLKILLYQAIEQKDLGLPGFFGWFLIFYG
jgi:hypothetical protein